MYAAHLVLLGEEVTAGWTIRANTECYYKWKGWEVQWRMVVECICVGKKRTGFNPVKDFGISRFYWANFCARETVGGVISVNGSWEYATHAFMHGNSKMKYNINTTFSTSTNFHGVQSVLRS
jgi:hypothetical protein